MFVARLYARLMFAFAVVVLIFVCVCVRMCVRVRVCVCVVLLRVCAVDVCGLYPSCCWCAFAVYALFVFVLVFVL